MLVNRGSPRRWRASFIAAMVTAFGLNVGASSRASLRVFMATLARLGTGDVGLGGGDPDLLHGVDPLGGTIPVEFPLTARPLSDSSMSPRDS